MTKSSTANLQPDSTPLHGEQGCLATASLASPKSGRPSCKHDRCSRAAFYRQHASEPTKRSQPCHARQSVQPCLVVLHFNLASQPAYHRSWPTRLEPTANPLENYSIDQPTECASASIVFSTTKLHLTCVSFHANPDIHIISHYMCYRHGLAQHNSPSDHVHLTLHKQPPPTQHSISHSP